MCMLLPTKERASAAGKRGERPEGIPRPRKAGSSVDDNKRSSAGGLRKMINTLERERVGTRPLRGFAP